jgi:Domain of unknown function (DUF3520)/von Willebrand factor
MNIDDPKLTAYALDELDEAERAAILEEGAASPEVQREVQETQTMARLLRKEFAAEAEQLRHRENTDATKAPLSANLSDIRDDPWFWTRARPLAIAAVFAVFAVIGLAIFGSNKLREKEIAQADQRSNTIPPRSRAVEAEVEDAQNPIASYAIVQRFINDGLLPPKDSVRIEEMINYFTYNYPRPKLDELFSIDVEVAGCPWADSHRLVRIGFRGREIADPVVKKDVAQQIDGTPVTIAREVKIQVEFNSAMVTSRRLMGYDKRMLRKDFNNDEIDAGEIAAGHMVTALYEVVPVGGAASPSVPPVDPLKYSVPPENARSNSSEMLTVKLRYKKPESDKSELLERAVVDDGKQFANASADFKFAVAVAEFGMLLRDSEFKGSGTLGAVLQWAQEGKGADTNGYRAGFLELVRKAQVLKRG